MKLDQSLPARFGDVRVHVLEVSVTGFLLAHEGRIAPGLTQPLVIDWQGRDVELVCNVVRSTLWRLAKTMGATSIYHSGVRIMSEIGDSRRALRELIAERIIRALDEQKANARGIPPLAAYMYQPGKGELYRRCEFIDGTWRKTETIRIEQPANGFTVSAEIDPLQVDVLCRTWESTTAEGKRLTQMLAELSIRKSEGVPTRRYEP
ncbi:MAG: hypothetical protein JO197_15955 [Acidobacteria bacterium]|nr:hypothetical protein [Acidobacteriota bacterium]MBV9474982.1 hypothetical protein [Acidobacteriota bacterium]